MRPSTVVIIGGVCAFFVGLAVLGLAGWGSVASGALTEAWISDTARDNRVNHHAVGAGPDGRVIVAPIAEVPHSDVPIGKYSCALVRLAPTTGSVLWRVSIPPDDCTTHALTQPAIADIDGDTALEVVVSTTEDALVVYDARTAREQFRVQLSTYGYGRPTIANVTPAPGREIVTSAIDGGVVVVEANGTVAWRAQVADGFANESSVSVWAAPIVADVTGDGRPEVVVGTGNGPTVLGNDGHIEWTAPGGAFDTATAQSDRDAQRELFTATRQTVLARDGATGAVEWRRTITGGARIRTAADADGDGVVELYVSRAGGIVALDATTGETDWNTTISTSDAADVPPPVLGDVVGDGQAELIAVVQTGTVVVLDPSTGSELASYERDVPIWTVPTPADLDDDGQDEILVRYGDGRVVALDLSTPVHRSRRQLGRLTDGRIETTEIPVRRPYTWA